MLLFCAFVSHFVMLYDLLVFCVSLGFLGLFIWLLCMLFASRVYVFGFLLYFCLGGCGFDLLVPLSFEFELSFVCVCVS